MTRWRASIPEKRLPVRLDDGQVVSAWVYFYNAPLGDAPRIDSGDYLEYLKAAVAPRTGRVDRSPIAVTSIAVTKLEIGRSPCSDAP